MRKNYTNFYNGINAAFGEAVQNLFTGEYHGTKCTPPLIVKILLFAACIAKSLFYACRSNAGFDSHTLANALIKILPNYTTSGSVLSPVIVNRTTAGYGHRHEVRCFGYFILR